MKPILSFCIPTYNRIDLLVNTINSIYKQATPEILPLFEVVVSDNSPTHECQALESEFSKYSNFHYHTTVCKGFLNSYYSLTYGNGEFLKLHNNTALLKDGALSHMIELLISCRKEIPCVFFSDGYRLRGKVARSYDFDQFMHDCTYFSSWSSGLGIWKEDFEKLKNIELDSFFPQTSLLLAQSYKKSYILDDYNLFFTQPVAGKGGYNIFKVFSVDYINMLKNSCSKGDISKKCYNYIRLATLYRFLGVRYFRTVIAKMDNFEHSDVKEHIMVNYTQWEYCKFLISSIWGPIRYFIREFYRSKYTQLK